MASSPGGSISPTTRTPRSQSPANTRAIGMTDARPTGIRTVSASKLQTSPNAPLPSPNSKGKASKLSNEATDYLNGGVSHNSPIEPRVDSSNAGLSAEQPAPKPFSSPPISFPHDTTINGTATPPGRRSVSFARDMSTEQFSSRTDSWGVEDAETPGRRGQSLMSKLKALATTSGMQTHGRSSSNPSNTYDESTGVTPHPSNIPHTLEEEEGSDADAEETADEGFSNQVIRNKKKRRTRRPQANEGGSSTVPNTPRLRAPGPADSPSGTRSFFLGRRATDGSLEARGHLSEGEGRDRFAGGSAWRRGSTWMNSRGLGITDSGQQELDGARSRRPSQFRRMTGLGGQSEGEAQTPRRPLFSGERASTFGAQRWRMLKHGLKLLGQRKEEHRVDYLKSAELMAELRAGAPAALMLASMIQRDEHGNKRIPVLLEQLKLSITDSKPMDDDADESERHLVFRIELEYGSGLNRMKWVIHRSLRDFANLHLRYKFQGSSDKYLRSDVDARPKQPRFPKSAFPYFRGVRGLGESDEDEADNIRIDETAAEATQSETERRRKKRRPSFSANRKSSRVLGADVSASVTLNAEKQKRIYNERQRRRLEQYLQEMIRWLIFRPESNRLCRFLELSSMGVRLAAEGSYHGKEGYLVIQSSKGLDMRRILTPQNVFARHSPKWFLVRHSYVVCVESPENMHIYDVYLVDAKFEIQKKRKKIADMGRKGKEKEKEKDKAEGISQLERSAKHPQHHSLKLQNSERKIKLLAKNERQLRQFEESIKYMVSNTAWSKPHRFGSFAPVRTGVVAQWLVDGRDYMWNVSRAINEAKDVIYIHDWWLSPQLYMRRPAAISQKWRLDRLLQKKAREGVKVFIIIYRNVEAAIPIDSEFTKFSMLDLHPNIFVQRSPNQFKKNQFFFAHHEKICIVDHTVAFVGGIDLCFGRWDTPQHSVVDDKPTGFEQSDSPKDADHCQLWPGKDYSNPRVQDFYKLSEPYAEMYDRTKTPRMPWHDVAMQIVGQPARDLTRHFVQRWNYVLRGRTPTRPTPFLLPPPDYNRAELEELGLTGTCEVQILRSASDWSLGLMETEHSIMNAYCKMIEESDHFVYMENQFFITSCETMNVKIVNKIGDAIVERAIRAHQNGESWRCVILIPLMPGFQNTVDEPEGTSIRLIMQCQFRSICRGEGSIFGRLRTAGIEPEDYVQFYSLRTWGRIGPKKMIVTEQLYIHAKVIIVDDRIALIGSANINERSMLGNRDSETAAVVRDTDMLWSTMDGKPYLVGRFAHELRMRLMREHLGLDVDEVMEEEKRNELDREEEEFRSKMDDVYDESEESDNEPSASNDVTNPRVVNDENLRSFNHGVDWEQAGNPNLQSSRLKPLTTDKRVTDNSAHAADVEGDGVDKLNLLSKTGQTRGRDSILTEDGREVLISDIAAEGRGTLSQPKRPHTRSSPAQRRNSHDSGKGYSGLPPTPYLPRRTTEQLGLVQLSQLPALPVVDDTDIGGPPVTMDATGHPTVKPFNPLTADIKMALVDKDCMRDPLNETFAEETWRQIAENNTKIYRRIFRCNPDNEVSNWHEYTEFVAYAERFVQAQGGAKTNEREGQESQSRHGPPGSSTVPAGANAISEKAKGLGLSQSNSHPLGTVSEWAARANAEHDARADTSDGTTSRQGQYDGNDEKAAAGRDEVVSPIGPTGDEAFPALDPTIIVTNTGAQGANRKTTFSATPTPTERSTNNTNMNAVGSVKKRRRGTTKGSRKGFSGSDDLLSNSDVEDLLSMIQGHLVAFPYDWLVKEELNSNWLYQVDQVAPLQI
ncbi:phospholipase D protein [Rutstroemia sp. NJR-2017a BVV2]|nr:phospholipase D protein [Rutstroemia sp. NJR-2017a BVV2]